MTDKKYETVLIEKEDGITWLIMNRPEKRNAMSPSCMWKWMTRSQSSRSTRRRRFSCSPALAKRSARAGIKLYFLANDDAPAARAKARHASNQWRWQGSPLSRSRPLPWSTATASAAALPRCAPAISRSLRTTRFRAFGGELGHSARRHRLVEHRADAQFPRRDVLCAHRRYLRRQKAKEIGFVNFSFPKRELRAETIKLAQQADGEVSDRTALHQGSVARGALHERATGSRLSRCQERCPAICRQGETAARRG